MGEGLADDAYVLKMAWHPADFDNGTLSAAAFRRGDLLPEIDRESGRPAFVSVDEKSCVVRAAVDDRIARQGAKDPINRADAKFVEYLCLTVRQMRDEIGNNPLDVRPERLPENEAHCGIHNVSTVERSLRERKAYVDELRSLLIEEGTHIIRAYQDVFTE